MSEPVSAPVREAIFSILADRGVSQIGDDEPLFSTGRLDSLAAAEILAMLEADYGLDLADEDFDIMRIDTLNEIEALLLALRSGQKASSAA